MKEKQLEVITYGDCIFEALSNEEQTIFCSSLLATILKLKKGD